jgi:hypothetical protein
MVGKGHCGPTAYPPDTILRSAKSRLSGLHIAHRRGGECGNFRAAIGSETHYTHQFRVGDQVQGVGIRVADPRLEIADLYKVSKLKLIRRGDESTAITPPWHAVPPPLEVYRQRGHRRLSVATYDPKCSSCLWGCAMPVEMIIDQWNPERRRYRTETFCYGPLSCPSYKPGPMRKVPRSPWHDLRRARLA